MHMKGQPFTQAFGSCSIMHQHRRDALNLGYLHGLHAGEIGSVLAAALAVAGHMLPELLIPLNLGRMLLHNPRVVVRKEVIHFLRALAEVPPVEIQTQPDLSAGLPAWRGTCSLAQ